MPPHFPFAALLLAHDATDADAELLETMTRDASASGAAPVIIALPPEVSVPSGARVVRTKRDAPTNALRLGMAQLTNTSARAVLLLPLRGAQHPLVSLLALLDAAKRAEDAIIAFEGATLDESPVLVPRDAWLELVTLGEAGMNAVSARRRVHRVEVPSL